MPKKELTYEEALSRIEDILGRIQREEVSVDSLAAEIGRAAELIARCKARLQRAESEVDKILE